MNLNKFYYFLVVLLCSISFTACSDDDDKQTVPHIELTASMSAFSEGILSFDEENGILSISKEGTLTSSITLGDAAGADMDGIALKATVPAADKMWCLATCSKNRLSLSVAKNNAENARQTTIEISALFGDQVLDTYMLIITQKGVEKEEEPAAADITAFIIPGQISSKIDYPVITITMPAGMDVTALKPVVVPSEGATVTPASGTVQDFTDAVQYTVVSSDQKNVKTYMAIVTLQSGGVNPPSGGNDEDNPNYTTFDMVTVSAGSFIIGRDLSSMYADKTNAHKVNISAFEIGRYEVTQREFQDVMGYNPSVNKKKDLLPVHTVTLYEAMLYCNKLSERKGYKPVYTFKNELWDVTNTELYEADVTRDKTANGYRLPTSAEWEYAAKGGPDNENQPYYYAGSNNLDEVGWYGENSIVGEEPELHVVGLKKPNSLGIYDMSGNVEEYTGEWLLQLGYISDAEETDPWGPEKPRDEERLVYSRGGCFSTYDTNCSNTNARILGAHIKTDMGYPGGDIWFGQIGFRVVRSLK